MVNKAWYLRFLIFLLLGFVVGASSASDLSSHSSPYLRLHAHDPIDWQLLNKSAIEKASRQNRLIFISSGYFACHWCHVMHQESFQNDQVAKVINESFIAIKMDREQQPATDKQLLEFVRRVRGYAGWPLNVILTPEGYPVAGFVYLPKDEFIKVLNSVNARWQEDPDRIGRLATAAAQQLSEPASDQVDVGTVSASRIMAEVRLQQDELQGGFGIQAKFPRVPLLLALFDQYKQQPEKSLADFLILTLDQIAGKGLRDHVNGGFFRYATTPDWLNPHYEKMLTDNALLIQLYVQAARLFPDCGYLQVAESTAEAMIELFYKDGFFRSSLSAVDAEGKEGAAYLWTADEVWQALDKKYHAFSLRWFGLDPALSDLVSTQLIPAVSDEQLMGHFDLTWIELFDRQQQVQDQLRAANRPGHALDDKALLGNNALAVTALLQLVEQLPSNRHSRYRELAEVLLVRLLRDFQQEGRWYRQVDQSHQVDAELEDLAYLAHALWTDYRINKRESSFSQLIDVLERCWSFYSEGYWLLARGSVLPWHYSAAALPDTALPSPAAMVMQMTQLVQQVSPDSLAAVPLKEAQANAQKLINEEPLNYASYW